jgi:serine/threonine protein kinase
MSIGVGDILGDYQVTGVLGRGGMGKVYRVRSLLTEREEAMKLLLADVEDNPDLVDRFLREIKVHASLRHPNIAELRTALRIGDRLVMILELVEGASLEERIRQGPVDAATAVSYMSQTLSALAYAHERGVIHRDIKPANILIGGGDVVKLTDFGIARATGTAHLTGTGMVVGTLPYMSPEQIRSGQVDARSDIYSLGLTFYETVTGRRAIQADTEHGLINAHFEVIPPEPAALNPGLPASISAAIMRAIAKQPGDRFQTAQDFAGALTGVYTHSHPATGVAFSAAELAELETRLSRAVGPIAKRLVADAARRYGSMAEIRRALAAQIDDPRERDQFAKRDTQPTTTMAMQTFDQATLDRMAQALAPYLGPIAKVMVARAARTARTNEELRDALASHIPSVDERRKFLAAADERR